MDTETRPCLNFLPIIRRFVWFCAFFMVYGVAASAQESADINAPPPSSQAESSQSGVPQFGGPDQVDNRIAEDAETTSRIVEKALIEPYLQWKKKLQEKQRWYIAMLTEL